MSKLHAILSRHYDEWSSYWRSLSQRRAPSTRFIFFAHARSGSHLFADLISTHPDVECVTEQYLFKRRRGIRAPYYYVDGISKRTASPVFGGKINIRHLDRQARSNEKTIAKFFAKHWKFIILQRENVLRQVISSQVAKQRKRYRDTERPTLSEMQITLDIPKLYQLLANKVALNERVAQLLAPYETLTVIYEKDLVGSEAQQRMADRVFRFLDLDSVPVKTRYAKSGVYALSDYITNYDELVASLQNTAYAQYLSERTA